MPIWGDAFAKSSDTTPPAETIARVVTYLESIQARDSSIRPQCLRGRRTAGAATFTPRVHSGHMLTGDVVRRERITGETPTLRGVVHRLLHRPDTLLRRWNYKSAVTSSLIRSSIFFAANLPAGRDAARAAFLTEIALRLATSGFWGALTQELGGVEPEWHAVLGAMVLVPLASHGIEALVHILRGTPALLFSLGASAAFTLVSTAFNVFAMRRGALITGPGSAPLHRDLLRIPSLLASFVSAPLTYVAGRRGHTPSGT